MMQLTKTRALAVLALVPMLLLGVMSAGPAHAAQADAQGFLQLQAVDTVTGATVPDALVIITSPASPNPVAQGKTDKSGSYAVMLPAGSYLVRVTNAYYRPFAQTIVIDPNQPTPGTHMGVHLTPLRPTPAPVPQPGCCSGPTK